MIRCFRRRWNRISDEPLVGGASIGAITKQFMIITATSASRNGSFELGSLSTSWNPGRNSQGRKSRVPRPTPSITSSCGDQSFSSTSRIVRQSRCDVTLPNQIRSWDLVRKPSQQTGSDFNYTVFILIEINWSAAKDGPGSNTGGATGTRSRSDLRDGTFNRLQANAFIELFPHQRAMVNGEAAKLSI
jgi:hypothetical protein